VRDTRPTAPTAPSRRRYRRGDESGAALVEFALVIGIFMLVLYGLISYGMIMATKQRVTNAASEAARSAVGEANDADAIAAATTRLNTLLSGSAGKYTPVVTTAACGTSTCVKVTVTWDWKNHPVVPPAPGIGLFTPDNIVSEAQVQYK
jgi:Flp pilus assembly protein TadG